MKKITLYLTLVLLASFTFTSCMNQDNPETNTAEHSTVKSEIAYIQIDSLIQGYDMFSDLTTELESKAEIIRKDLNKKGRAFQNSAKDLDSRMKKGTITSYEANNQRTILLKRQENLQNYSNQKSQEMSEEQQVMINKVMDAIQTYVVEFNKTANYKMILTNSNVSNTILTADPALNITDQILKGINEEYIKNKKNK
ncbi:MAG: OmpH family outer membrane protein [Bacteroidales bacterium]